MFQDAFGQKTCIQICASARKDSDLHQEDIGGIVCEDGKACPCAFGYPHLGVKTGECPEIDDVVVDHEKGHIAHGSECDPNNPCPHRGSGGDDGDECRQRREDMPKLSKLSKKSGKCGLLARQLLSENRLYVNRNCKKSK